MENNASSVSVQGLRKRYGACEAVRGVSFELARGEVFGLLGANGAGKTTTLECVLGLRTADEGQVIIEGVDVVREPARARRLLGAQLQGGALQDKITPREALRMFAGFYGDAGQGEELLEKFGLKEKAAARFDTLSGGTRQRLLLALAFVGRPRVVVLDEPTAGLDVTARRELHALIRAERDAGTAVVLSTHQMEEAAGLCDRVGILHEGRLVAVGAPAELVRRAGARPRIVVRTAPALAEATVIEVKGCEKCERVREAWQLEGRDVAELVGGVAEATRRAGAQLVELRVEQPTLEDAFVALTGAAWSEEGEGRDE